MILSARKLTLLCIIVAFSLLEIKLIFTYAATSNGVPIELNKTYNGTLYEGKKRTRFYKFLTINGNVTLSMKKKTYVRCNKFK